MFKKIEWDKNKKHVLQETTWTNKNNNTGK